MTSNQNRSEYSCNTIQNKIKLSKCWKFIHNFNHSNEKSYDKALICAKYLYFNGFKYQKYTRYYILYIQIIYISINSKTKLFLYLKFKNDSKISSTYYGNEKAFFINENHFSCFWHLNNLLAFKIYNIIIRKLNKIFV